MFNWIYFILFSLLFFIFSCKLHIKNISRNKEEIEETKKRETNWSILNKTNRHLTRWKLEVDEKGRQVWKYYR